MAQGTTKNIMRQVLIVLLILFVGVDANAAAPSVLISPKKLVPGGLMIVTVKNAVGTVEGSFRGKPLHFNPAKGSAKRSPAST